MEGLRINEISVSHYCNFHSHHKLTEDTNWHQKAYAGMLFLSKSQTTLAPVNKANKIILVVLLEYLRTKQRPEIKYYFYDYYHYSNNYIAEFFNLQRRENTPIKKFTKLLRWVIRVFKVI